MTEKTLTEQLADGLVDLTLALKIKHGTPAADALADICGVLISHHRRIKEVEDEINPLRERAGMPVIAKWLPEQPRPRYRIPHGSAPWP